MTMSERLQADVIVVGGGIVGCSTAFHLRHVQAKRVVLLERGLAGSQASGVNFGNVRRQGRFLPQLPLSHRAREIWGRLPELIGEDCEFQATGHLRLAFSEADMAAFETHARGARDYGLELELMGRNRLRALYPWVGPEAVGGSLSPFDGQANPRLAAPAFARAARRLGAEIREHCEVVAIERLGTGFRVACATGLIVEAPVLLNAAGAWGAKIAASFGEHAPIAVRGPQMAVTEPLPYFLGPTIGTGDGDIYARQIPRGNVIFGGGERGPASEETQRAYVMCELTRAQFARVTRLAPILEGAMVIRAWSGIEAYLPDMIPIMGPSATTPGLFHAFAFCGHGFQLGPGVGAVMAELTATGATSTPIAPFSIARFAPVSAAAAG
jgi:sarcosine oxidase subunit beta